MNDLETTLPPLREGPLAGHTLDPTEALAALDATEAGLSTAEADGRRAAIGPNVIPKAKRAGLAVVYLRQFKNPLVYLLVAATVVSLGVGELADAAFIFVVLQFNAVIGTYQERRAESAANALEALIPNIVVVRRDGQRQEREATELVPGDVVELESGSHVPADLRLLEGREMTVDESLLTGESTPVTKDAGLRLEAATPIAERRNMLFAGSTLLVGRALGLVAATGGRTEIGRIAEALIGAEALPPPLVQRLERFSRNIGIATMVLIAVIGAAQLLQGVPLVTVFLVAVALAVAAIPEGLPVAITVALAIATHRMAQRHVIVRALPAVEGLGACTLIASDKTGTLTCNELSVTRALLYLEGQPAGLAEIGGDGGAQDGPVAVDGRALKPEESEALERLAETGALCNEASVRFTEDGVERLGDTVDLALLILAIKRRMEPDELRGRAGVLGVIPYEPRRRYAATFVTGRDDGGAVAHVKGAAEVVLPMCREVDEAAALAEVSRLAEAGFRVLALARGSVDRAAAVQAQHAALRGLELLGFVGLIDPLRPEVPDAVSRCRSAGVAVRMITGDHPQTALAIAREIGIAERAEQVATGAELAAAESDAARFDALVERSRVFARVDPLQKLSIVESMRRGGHVVAVTGDGVNDAPALSAADLGVAMGRQGTDVARSAADLILTDDNFASIAAGVEEGRIAYDNVRKLVFLLITTGLGEIVLFLLAIMAGLPVPLTAVQLLWLNLVTNGIQHIALAFERGEPGVMERRPRPPGQPIFDRRMVVQVLAAGCYMGLAGFVFFDWCLRHGMSEAVASNLLLLLMVLFENAQCLNARSESRSILSLSFAGNPFLLVAILGALALHVSTMFLPGISTLLGTAPVPLTDFLVTVTIALSLIVAVEAQKQLYGRWIERPDGRRA